MLAASSLKERELRIEADGIRGRIGEQTVAEGTVSLEQGTIQLQADSMKIDWDGNDINLITATGTPVKLEKNINSNIPPLVAYADKVFFYPLEQNLILFGNVNLRQNKNTFIGHEIHYDLVTGELEAASGNKNNKRVEIIWHSDNAAGKDR